MQMWQSTEAARLAGVTPAQLREWTVKRRIIDPDVPGRGAGRHALYGWQTILIISVLGELRREFGIELGRWGSAANYARRELESHSFIKLWGGCIVFENNNIACLALRPLVNQASAVNVFLDPHLSRLANEMRMPGAPSQLPLLAPIGARQ